MKHIMLDLETLGTGPRAAVVAIGAVAFNPTGIADKSQPEFFSRIALASAMLHGEVDAPTLYWWLEQSDAARQATFRGVQTDLSGALNAFNNWLLGLCGHNPGELRVWGNGATFDNVVIRSAMKAVGVDPAWSFRHDCCYRTVVALVPEEQRPVPPPRGTHHHAIDDAKWQAEYLRACWKALGLQ